MICQAEMMCGRGHGGGGGAAGSVGHLVRGAEGCVGDLEWWEAAEGQPILKWVFRGGGPSSRQAPCCDWTASSEGRRGEDVSCIPTRTHPRSWRPSSTDTVPTQRLSNYRIMSDWNGAYNKRLKLDRYILNVRTVWRLLTCCLHIHTLPSNNYGSQRPTEWSQCKYSWQKCCYSMLCLPF